MKKLWQAFIADCDPNGGIYRYALTEDGSLELLQKLDMDRPMYMELHGKELYVIVRELPGEKNSGITKVTLAEDGTMTWGGAFASTLGLCGCHLTVDSETKETYAVNYLSGSVIKLPENLVTHVGKSVHPTRQEAAHTHQILFTPDGKYLAVNDLGMDLITLYDRDLKEISSVKAPAGAGPRHTVFSRDGKFAYVVNELTSDVSVYRYADGTLTYCNTYAALPADYHEQNTAAAIRLSPDGKYLYASHRGHDSIARFAVDGEKLTLLDIVPSGGKEPRDFDLTPDGTFAIATNQVGKNAAVFRVENGKLIDLGKRVALASPLAVVFGAF